jgi:hypothetical protein
LSDSQQPFGHKKTRRGEGEACCGLNGIAPITVKLPATRWRSALQLPPASED